MLKRKIQGISSCVSIKETVNNDPKLKNSLNIYVNDDTNKIFDNYQNLRIVNSGYKKYVSVLDTRLTFNKR